MIGETVHCHKTTGVTRGVSVRVGVTDGGTGVLVAVGVTDGGTGVLVAVGVRVGVPVTGVDGVGVWVPPIPATLLKAVAPATLTNGVGTPKKKLFEMVTFEIFCPLISLSLYSRMAPQFSMVFPSIRTSCIWFPQPE